jgi:3-dehydroquinate synthase
VSEHGTDDEQSMMDAPLQIRSRLGDYAVEFVVGGAWARELAALNHTFVVVDENVWCLHADGVLAPLRDAEPVVLPISETGKVYATVAELYDQVTARATKRNCVVVSIGGGITQDLTGYLASTLYRGVRWFYAPTTLLAMADSCIGGKTSLNHGAHKNLIGTMYPPERVLVHAPFVGTLGEQDYFSGLGEVVKLHLLGGQSAVTELRETLPALLARDPVAVRGATRASLMIKRAYIEEDEFDRGRRNLLNYGHCFGHAVETATGFAVPHGQAVVIGMLLAGAVARRRGLLAVAEERRRRAELLLPVLVDRPLLDEAAATRVVAAMKYDKKRTGEGLALVMVGDGLQAVQVADLSESEARDALADLPALYGA